MKAKRKPRSNRVASDELLGVVEPGRYSLKLYGDQYDVKVWDALLGQWPDNKEVRMVQFLSGGARFPAPLVEVIGQGGVFTPNK